MSETTYILHGFEVELDDYWEHPAPDRSYMGSGDGIHYTHLISVTVADREAAYEWLSVHRDAVPEEIDVELDGPVPEWITDAMLLRWAEAAHVDWIEESDHRVTMLP